MEGYQVLRGVVMVDEFDEMWKIGKILKSIKNNDCYWLDGNILFEYEKGYKKYLQKRFDELFILWREKHPFCLLNDCSIKEEVK